MAKYVYINFPIILYDMKFINFYEILTFKKQYS